MRLFTHNQEKRSIREHSLCLIHISKPIKKINSYKARRRKVINHSKTIKRLNKIDHTNGDIYDNYTYIPSIGIAQIRVPSLSRYKFVASGQAKTIRERKCRIKNIKLTRRKLNLWNYD